MSLRGSLWFRPYKATYSLGSAQSLVVFRILTIDIDSVGLLPGGYWPGMLIVGLVLMLIGFLLAIPILWTIGIVLAIVGLVLLVLGRGGREFDGRRYWY